MEKPRQVVEDGAGRKHGYLMHVYINTNNAWSYTTFEKSSLSVSHTHTYTAVSPAGLLTRLQKKTPSPVYTTAYQKHTGEKISRYFTANV